MAKTDDTQAQAAEFLRAWQEQMARSMTDPAAIHAMLSALSAFTPRGTSDDARTRRPAPAPDAHDDAIRDLTERLDAVERELAKLRKPVPAKAKKPARAKPRSVAKRKPAVARRAKPKSKARKRR